MKRFLPALAVLAIACGAHAQVTLTGDVRNAAGQGVTITPNAIFVQSCNTGSGGIVGQGSCTLPDGGGGGGGAVTLAFGAVAAGAYSAGSFVSGAFLSGSYAPGSIVDLGTGSSPGANTTNGYLKQIQTYLAGTLTVALPAAATGGGTPYHFISTASTNSTLVSTGAHTLYSLTLSGLNTTVGYVRVYDSAGAPACSSATGAVHTYAVIGSATQVGGIVVPLPAQGELYASGLGFCVTGGSADTDNTSGPAGILFNATYK